MKITYRIPSKKVPCGYLELQADVDVPVNGLPDAVALANDYAQFIKDYQAAEVAAFESSPKAATPKVKPEDDINDVASDMIKDGLGATDVTDAPWGKTDTPTESKEWTPPETEAVANDSDDVVWDF